MIILTLFGTTTGLELQNFPLGNNIPALKFEEAWVGVTPGQVSLRRDKDAFVVLRRSVGGHAATWIGIYRQAREMGYDRPGGFYGAGAWIIGHVADARLLTESLFEMVNQIQAKTMNGDRFVRNIAEARNEFAPPSQTAALLASLTNANSGLKPEGESAFIVEGTHAIDVIEWAQRAPSASYFSKAVIGAADQAPSAGQSSALRLFASHSLAIDAAYQRLDSEYRNAISQAKNQIHELSQTIGQLKKDNFSLNDDLKHARALLIQAQTTRMPSPASARYQRESYLTPKAPPNFTGMYLDSADDRWPTQAPTQRPSTISAKGFVGSARTQPSGLAYRQGTSAANPDGQLKPQGAGPETLSNKAAAPRSKNLVGSIFNIFIVVFIILAIIFGLDQLTRDKKSNCLVFNLKCSSNPSKNNPSSSTVGNQKGSAASTNLQDDAHAK